MASAFDSPYANKTIFLAFKMEPIPIEIAFVGTSASFSKKRAFALMVDSVNCTSCVLLSKAAPGSLNPM